jgi:tRNA(fMet)-specific endonuclease VapC
MKAMLKAMLDTNLCIYLINRHPPSVTARFRQYRTGEVGMSAITWGELCCGLSKHNPQAELDAILAAIPVLPFDDAAGAAFGRLSRQFPIRKNSFDRLIAAHALALGVRLATNNTDDFAPFEAAGLKLENWV